MRDGEVAESGKAIADVLRAKREALGLSKNALAQKAGISVQTVSFIETTVNSPSLSTFLRICDALEVRQDPNAFHPSAGNPRNLPPFPPPVGKSPPLENRRHPATWHAKLARGEIARRL